MNKTNFVVEIWKKEVTQEMIITAQDLHIVRKLEAIAKRAVEMKPVADYKTFKQISKKIPINKN